MNSWIPLLKTGATVWFFLTFVGVLAWTLAHDKRRLETCKYLPLEDDHAQSRRS